MPKITIYASRYHERCYSVYLSLISEQKYRTLLIFTWETPETWNLLTFDCINQNGKGRRKLFSMCALEQWSNDHLWARIWFKTLLMHFFCPMFFKPYNNLAFRSLAYVMSCTELTIIWPLLLVVRKSGFFFDHKIFSNLSTFSTQQVFVLYFTLSRRNWLYKMFMAPSFHAIIYYLFWLELQQCQEIHMFLGYSSQIECWIHEE